VKVFLYYSYGAKTQTHTHNTTIFYLKEIFYLQFLSTDSSKHNTVTQTVHCLQPSTAVYYSTLHKKAPIETTYFYYIISHVKTLNCVALVSLPRSKLARAPCFYYLPYEIKTPPSYPLQDFSFYFFFLII
jgi:hypothetical protein